MDNQMENEMETVVIWDYVRGDAVILLGILLLPIRV